MGKRRKGRGKAWKSERREGGSPGPAADPLRHAWPDATLDLHGRTVHEAEVAARNFLLTQSRLGAGRIVHIVTGKGTGRLFLAVGELLRGDFEQWVDDAASDFEGAGWRVRVR
ncbi:MAG: Smr/MutS family protein [Longimicrobiales bacterium]